MYRPDAQHGGLESPSDKPGFKNAVQTLPMKEGMPERLFHRKLHRKHHQENASELFTSCMFTVPIKFKNYALAAPVQRVVECRRYRNTCSRVGIQTATVMKRIVHLRLADMRGLADSWHPTPELTGQETSTQAFKSCG